MATTDAVPLTQLERAGRGELGLEERRDRRILLLGKWSLEEMVHEELEFV